MRPAAIAWDGQANRWTGDEWRWRLDAPATVRTVAVIEPAKPEAQEAERERRAGAERVLPFGFARALVEAALEHLAAPEPGAPSPAEMGSDAQVDRDA